MNRKISAISALLAVTLALTACGSGGGSTSKFTAATRVESEETEPSLTLPTETSAPESVPDAQTPSALTPNRKKKNEYGLYDQYFLDSLTNKFNIMVAERHFTADVNYLQERPDGKWDFDHNEHNEINGRDRHIQRLSDPNSGVYDSDIYYLKDTQQHYCAYGLNWDDFTYSVLLDIDAEYENELLDGAISEILFYGIDDLETAVYMGYITDMEKGTTTEQFMIDDVVYTFTYGADGYLKDSRGNGRRVKVRSFENSCPAINIPPTFTFKE